MSIIQISKIQQRSGNLVDLPQLDEAEFGWASDAKKLYIGKTTPNENIEVLTSYSQINYSQINGTVGNLNISNVTVGNGQFLVYDGTDWVNRGGTAGGLLNLGDVSNVKITGGAIGYVLETDGLGNLSWTPKSSVISYIQNVTKADPAVVTTTQDNFFTDRTQITITDAAGMSDLNGKSYYIDVLTSNTFALYANADLTGPIDSTLYNSYSYTNVTGTTTSTNIITVGNTAPFNENQAIQFLGDMGNSALATETVYYIKDILGLTTLTVSDELLPNGVAGNIKPVATETFTGVNMFGTGGRAIAAVGTSSGGKAAEGTDTTVQFNKNNLLAGDADFTWTYSGSKVLTIVGNANVGNLNANGVVSGTRLTSNIPTGTAPLTVTSTTRVANLNVSYANVTDFVNVSAPGVGTGYLVLANATTGNVAEYTSSGISANLANNAITATTFVGALSGAATTAETVTTNAQPNITSVGRLTNLTVGNSTANTVFGNGTISVTEATNASWIISAKTSGLTNDTGIYVDAANNFQFAARDGANVLRVVIDANASSASYINSGNVGVGTIAPAGKLDVVGNAYVGADINNSLFIGSNSGFVRIGALGRTSASNSGLQLFTSTISSTVTAVTIDTAGNVGIGNTAPTHTLSVTGTTNVSGNANVGNLGTSGLITATGNVSGGNLTTTGILSVTGNANIGNLGTATAVITTGNITTVNTGLVQNGNSNISISANGNISLSAAGTPAELLVTSTGVNVAGTLNVTGNANVGNLGAATGIFTTGNITTINSGLLQNGASNVAIASGANVTLGVAGTTRITATTVGANVTGTLGVSGNANVGNIGAAAGSFTANVTAGNVYANAGTVGALQVLTGNLTTGANTTAGAITGTWTLTAGSTLQATYADLAEYYEADDIYVPGTVLMFGGDKEVTLAEDGTNRVAGVVSTNPAYVMNATCPGLLTAVALQGRVPCKVRGKIRKGDMLISGGNGFARPEKFPSIGTVIGKALQDFDGYEGVIEVAVGRL